MQITVEYTAQMKRAAGVATEAYALDGGLLDDLVAQIAARHDDAFRDILLTENGDLHPSILVFINDQQVRGNDNPILRDGQTVSFLSPISGG